MRADRFADRPPRRELVLILEAANSGFQNYACESIARAIKYATEVDRKGCARPQAERKKIGRRQRTLDRRQPRGGGEQSRADPACGPACVESALCRYGILKRSSK